ncbi:MAG TPA: hypothetical protein VGJ29_16245 [Vicinamibacterales bacterium]|jgi:hypothetical protein
MPADGRRGLERLQSIARQSPRASSALLFGGATLTVTYFTWIPDARTSGLAPALTIAAGAVHAFAGSFTGRRLLDDRRTRSFADAGLVGVWTSLLALAIFSPLFAIFLFATDIMQPSNWIGYLVMPVLVAVFAFLAIGWALMLVSSAVGCVLYGLASM